MYDYEQLPLIFENNCRWKHKKSLKLFFINITKNEHLPLYLLKRLINKSIKKYRRVMIFNLKKSWMKRKLENSEKVFKKFPLQNHQKYYFSKKIGY